MNHQGPGKTAGWAAGGGGSEPLLHGLPGLMADRYDRGEGERFVSSLQNRRSGVPDRL